MVFKKGARPVKKPTTETATPKRVRQPLPTWPVPADFKAFYADLIVRTDKDGLLCAKGIKMVRYVSEKSKADPTKVFDMVADDPITVMGVLSRFSTKTFVTNTVKRLPANTAFKLVLRVGMSKKDESNPVIKCGLKSVSEVTVKKVKTASGIKKKAVVTLLDKKDPNRRKFANCVKFLGSAFQNVLAPRVRTREENKALREQAGFVKSKARKQIKRKSI